MPAEPFLALKQSSQYSWIRPVYVCKGLNKLVLIGSVGRLKLPPRDRRISVTSTKLNRMAFWLRRLNPCFRPQLGKRMEPFLGGVLVILWLQVDGELEVSWWWGQRDSGTQCTGWRERASSHSASSLAISGVVGRKWTLTSVSTVTNLLFLALCFCPGVNSQKIEQNPRALNIHEGETAAVTCNYTSYSPAFLQWYRQDPERGLVFLLLIRENEGEKQEGRLKVTFDTTHKQSSFYITDSQPADSATYLCAAG